MSQFVYIISDGFFQKIGVTASIEGRMAGLQTANAGLLGLLLCVPVPAELEAEHLESDLHRIFAAKRMRGEWFSLSDGDLTAAMKYLATAICPAHSAPIVVKASEAENPRPEKLLLNKREVQYALGIGETTLWRFEKRGLIRPLEGHRHRLYRIQDVRRLAQKGGAK